MIITFFGHRSLYGCEHLSEDIYGAIISHMKPNEKTLFYCGGYGDFDQLCARVCRSIKGSQTNCEIVFITPYITEAQQKKLKYMIDEKLYDSTIYPPLEQVPNKFAICRRNEWMVREADLIIAYVNQTFGGAYKALEYACKRKKHIINLAK